MKLNQIFITSSFFFLVGMLTGYSIKGRIELITFITIWFMSMGMAYIVTKHQIRKSNRD